MGSNAFSSTGRSSLTKSSSFCTSSSRNSSIGFSQYALFDSQATRWKLHHFFPARAVALENTSFRVTMPTTDRWTPVLVSPHP